MQLRKILTLIAAAALTAAAMPSARAQSPATARGDEVLLEMNQAFRQGQRARLSQLLPQLRGHPLEAWGAYWELRARLDTASPQELQDFFTRHAGTYQEDRLRNDWLLLLGSRRDWTTFASEHPRFRMNDDPQVRCYAIVVQQLREGATPAMVDEVRRLWHNLREPEDGCLTAARNLLADNQRAGRAAAVTGLDSLDVWRKARLAAEYNRPPTALAAIELVAPEALGQAREALANPARFLNARVVAFSRMRKELITVALARLAATEPESAAAALDGKWSPQLTREERNWLWGAIGRQAAQRLSPDALQHFAKVTHLDDLPDEMLAWQARAALRASPAPQWRTVQAAIEAMSPRLREDSTWIY